MKMKIHEKALDLFYKHYKKVSLLKTHKVEEREILSSYIVNIKEAYSDIKYYFIRLKNGEMGLYMLPNFKFLAGTNLIDKKEFEKITKKEYKSKEEFSTQEQSEPFFYSLYGEYYSSREEKIISHPYIYGFSYLTSLYHNKNEKYEESYNKLYDRLKRECDNLGIVYNTNPEKIIEEKLNIYQENDRFKLQDVTICKNKDSIDKYYEERIKNCTNEKQLERELSKFSYLRAEYISAIPGEFLIKANLLISALQDRNFPNRESILKNYMEFFIAKDYAFDIARYTKSLLNEGLRRQINLEQERYNSNQEFMRDLENVIRHDSNKEIYRYHVTTCEESAKKILEEGFYMFAAELDATSFKEFDVNEVLTFAYGNGHDYFGDYIIIISEPTDENIVEELQKEEYENLKILPRRMAIAAIKPKWKVDKKHIVAIVDKEHERVILNPEYQNTDKKQL